MKQTRKQTRDLRSGRAWDVRVGELAASPGPPAATTYTALTEHLAQLRLALVGERRGRSFDELRRCYVDLDRALGQAVEQAFAADAQGAAMPDGMVSWAAEGLARSRERELAMLAAMD